MHLHLNKIAFLALMVALLGENPAAASQQPSLNINGTEISLGMERNEVLAKLLGYHLQCLDEKRVTIERCNSLHFSLNHPPFSGHIFFMDDKASIIQKYWMSGPHEVDKIGFYKMLFLLLSRYNEHGIENFTVSVSEFRKGEILWQTIKLTSGRKEISIDLTEGARSQDGKLMPPGIQLTETLQ